MAATPAFLPAKSHGERSLADYSLWDHKTVRHNQLNNNDNKRGRRKFWEMMHISVPLIMMMASWMNTYLQAHQVNVYIKVYSF